MGPGVDRMTAGGLEALRGLSDPLPDGRIIHFLFKSNTDNVFWSFFQKVGSSHEVWGHLTTLFLMEIFLPLINFRVSCNETELKVERTN